MIDMHTHILPELDDGSSSVDESRNMLDMLLKQDVDTIVATPHFYIDINNIGEFLEKRTESINKLMSNIGDIKRPQIALGAEVQFCHELYSMENIEKLCISGTRYMLVEMPFSQWTNYTYKNLSKLYMVKGIMPIVAHIERYLDYQEEPDFEVVKRLKEADALIQMNSSFLVSRTTRRRALALIKKGLINFLGSDCHNMAMRPPKLRDGFDVIYEKVGESGLDAFAYWEEKLKDRIETI